MGLGEVLGALLKRMVCKKKEKEFYRVGKKKNLNSFRKEKRSHPPAPSLYRKSKLL